MGKLANNISYAQIVQQQRGFHTKRQGLWMNSQDDLDLNFYTYIQDSTRPCEKGNWDTWMVPDPWNQV